MVESDGQQFSFLFAPCMPLNSALFYHSPLADPKLAIK